MSEYLTRLAAARGLETKAFVSRATVADLRKDAASRGIAGRSRMGKRELARAVKTDPAVAAARKEAAALIREVRSFKAKARRGFTPEEWADDSQTFARIEIYLDGNRLTNRTPAALDSATRKQLEAALKEYRSLALARRSDMQIHQGFDRVFRANSRVTRTARKPAGLPRGAKPAEAGGGASSQKDRWAKRAAKREEWAKAQEARAAALEANKPEYASDWAFITQPGPKAQRIRDKLNARDERAYAARKKAEEHREKAKQLQRMASTNKGDAEARRQTYRDAISTKLEKGTEVVDSIFGQGVVVRVNDKTVRVRLLSGKEFTRDKSYIKILAK